MYVFTKAIEFVLEPGNALVVLLLAGVALQWTRWPRKGLYVTTAAGALFLILLVLPIGTWLVRPLENRYARPPWPRTVDGILVLGGGLDVQIYLSRGAPSEDLVEGRLVAAAELARRYPRARIVYSGGSGAVFGDHTPEASVARLAFAQLGIDEKRITIEDRSRNTWENLVYSQKLAKPSAGQTWVLATSASQLPRAMAIAKKLRWNLLPWPSDYSTSRSGVDVISDFDLVDNLTLIDAGLHEWMGILAYRIMGRTG